jgi:hypothetical protein
MGEKDNIQQNKHAVFATKKVLLIMVGVADVIAMTCFIIVALLPRPEGPFFKAPLRSFLTGLGVLGVAFPPYIVGRLLKKRAAASPYFELSFIKTGFNIFAFVCFIVGLTCIGLSVYALIERALSAG